MVYVNSDVKADIHMNTNVNEARRGRTNAKKPVEKIDEVEFDCSKKL